MSRNNPTDSQLRHNDCGISAIKTVCNILDVRISREVIQSAVRLDENGSTLSSLQQFFQKYGFATQYRLVDVNTLASGGSNEVKEWLPAILPINLKGGGLHYVVIEALKDNKFSVLDPSSAQRYQWTFEEFRSKSYYAQSLLNYADLSEVLRVQIEAELVRWQISLRQKPTPKDYPELFNKIQYFNYIYTRFGFRNEKAAGAFLEDMLLNHELQAIPESFKNMRALPSQIEIRTPVLLSVKIGNAVHQESSASESPNLYWRLYKSIKGVRDIWFIFLFSTLVASLFGYFSVFINQLLIDHVLPSYDQTVLQTFAIGVGIYSVLELFFYAYKKTVSIYLGNVLDRYFLGVFDEKLNFLSIQFVQGFRRGDLTERLSDSTKLKSFFVSFFSNVFINAVTALFSLVALFLLQWQLALLTLLVLAVFYVIFQISTPILVRLEQRRFSAKATFFSKFIEKIDGIQVIRAMNIEAQTSADIRQKIDEMVSIQTRASLVSLGNSLITKFVTMTASLSFLVIASSQLIGNNAISLGMIITFLSLSSRIFSSFQSLLDENLSLQEFNVTLSRFFDFNEYPNPSLESIRSNNGNSNKAETQKIVEKRKLPPQFQIQGLDFEKLTLHNVYFSYLEEKWILQNMNFEILKGERVWIQGGNGAGKSTFCKIISLLYPSTKGQILINGIDSHTYDQKELRKRIVFVSADDLIFNETLLYNITFGRPVDMLKLTEYANVLNFMEFINDQSEGFNHIIFEKGQNLSTGQRKKLLLLRALMTDADVIILDEVFNGLDEASKTNTEFLLGLLTKITFIIISHMPIEKMRFDKKYILRNGQLDLL